MARPLRRRGDDAVESAAPIPWEGIPIRDPESGPVRFDDFRFDPATRRLWRRREPVELQPQAARLLALLLEHAGELVSHARIIDALWPDCTVEYAQGIHNVVRQVRRALADDPASPSFVQTVPRRGYRFIAPVRAERDGDSRTGLRRAHVAATLVAAALVIAGLLWATAGVPPGEPSTLPPAAAAELAKARHLLLYPGPDDVRAAVARLRTVVAAAPAHAPAHALIADARRRLSPPDWDGARRAAGRALELDPGDPTALRVRGELALYRDWDWGTAGRMLRAAAGAPGAGAEAHVAYALYLAALGRHDESLAHADAAVAREPLAALLRTDLAYVHYLAGRHDRAREHAEEALALHAGAGGLLTDVLLAQGDLQAAARRMGVAWSPGMRRRDLEGAYLRSRRDDWLALPPERRPSTMVWASVAARLGETERALDLLERALGERTPAAPFLAVDPDLAPLRGMRRFEALVRATGRPGAARSRPSSTATS